MAPKKSQINNNNTKFVKDVSSLSLSDVICPICLSILIEPVCMPCNHMLCSPCFQDTLAQAALQCPLCRARISVWVRKATKAGTLVNQEVWKWIQENYKHKVEARLNGIEESYDEGPSNHVHKIQESTNGEIRQEFEIELKIHQLERHKEQLKEEEASKQLIYKMQLQQEKQLLEEELASKELILKLREEDTERDDIIDVDKELAREVRRQLHFKSQTSPPARQGPMDAFLASSSKKRDRISNGRFESRQFLKDITHSGSTSSSEDNSEEICKPRKKRRKKLDKENINSKSQNNIITNKYSLNNSITKLDYDSEETDHEESWFKNKKINLKKNKTRESDVQFIESNDNTLPEVVDISSEATTSDVSVADVTAAFSHELPDSISLDQLIEEQKQVEARLKQERDDRKYALLLQKQMKQVDRRKGTNDEYSLRQKTNHPTTSQTVSLKQSQNSKNNKSTIKTKNTQNQKLTATGKSGRQTTIFESLKKIK